ncbi:DUF6893 family small protein [Streptomyces sp. NPDC001922]
MARTLPDLRRYLRIRRM